MLARICLVVSSERFDMVMFTPSAIITHKRHNSNQEPGHASVTGQGDVWQWPSHCQQLIPEQNLPTYLAVLNVCNVFYFF